jgi:hypothetical protein
MRIADAAHVNAKQLQLGAEIGAGKAFSLPRRWSTVTCAIL